MYSGLELSPYSNILLPPPALPPGGSYFADYYCPTTEGCQKKYNDCITRSLEGKAHFPKCHDTFMKECMPLIRRCQGK